MRRKTRQNSRHPMRNIIFEYIKDNAKSYLILIIIFFIGLILVWVSTTAFVPSCRR